jgi:hypothetical protein
MSGKEIVENAAWNEAAHEKRTKTQTFLSR